MQVERLLSLVFEELRERLPEGTMIGLSMGGPIGATSFALEVTVDGRPYFQWVDGTLVETRPDEWGETLAKGLAPLVGSTTGAGR
jgi:hypothetical protein